MIQAIETVYNGYRFRSRLEARWAVFFDKLGVPYEYEREGFDLDGLRYLPDFWLPDQRTWMEVKPDKPTEAESEKARRLAKASDRDVVIVVGEPWQDDPGYPGYNRTDSGYIFLAGEGGWDNYYTLAVCPQCGKRGWAYSDYAERICQCYPGTKGSSDWSVLQRAYVAARQARFEHGQTPRGPRV